MTTTSKQLSIADIKVGDLEAIEKAVGVRMSEWMEPAPKGVPSLADLLSRVYAALSDQPLATVKDSMSLGQLLESVSLDTSEQTTGKGPTKSQR